MIEFFVPGIPQPGGSKRAFVNKKTGRAIVTEDNVRCRDWRAVVADQAQASMNASPFRGAVSLEITFYMPRPKGHFGTGRNVGKLKASAPDLPTVRPDATKLLRALEDALKGICWIDDAQVVEQHVYRRYGDRPGAHVLIAEIINADN